ncbi:uracil phosphoribosyltransferase homolog isoform X1 [Schistocerca piceifrons]|uniref:uracil phosphoribosyltransferase homolog isoform X1 n=1 Tax=Schistocerca piceifrons TaxID=274613 RepID=UPI001F5F9657|nr:uracil phosphoribosyltransferase homolog isoform X1 [Schistocerca piceifrons]
MGSAGELSGLISRLPEHKNEIKEDYGPNLKILPNNDQVKELQTILRDRNTSRSDFKFYADRLIRLVIEESLNQLPFTKCVVTTPTGAKYEGLKYQKGNCGVSIVRSGEAMEQGLRDCCRSIRIGKILVESDAETHEARVVYARFPEDIADRKVLVMYPIMSTGNTVIKAVAVLREHHVPEENIILSNLFCTPFAAKLVTAAYPQLTFLGNCELHTGCRTAKAGSEAEADICSHAAADWTTHLPVLAALHR